MRKRLLTGVIAATVAVTSLVAVSSSQAASIDYSKCTDLTSCGGMDALVKAAQKEGKLNVITIPRDWANYGEALDLFTKAFGIKIADDNPDGSSAYEIQTVKTAPKSKAPDAVDVGITYGADNVNLFAPYKVATWKDIPAQWKEASGRWAGDYYGQIALAYDTSVTKAPKSFADLKDPAFKGQVAIGGDPTGAQEALMSVFAANLASGGTPANIQPGIDSWIIGTVSDWGRWGWAESRRGHMVQRLESGNFIGRGKRRGLRDRRRRRRGRIGSRRDRLNEIQRRKRRLCYRKHFFHWRSWWWWCGWAEWIGR